MNGIEKIFVGTVVGILIIMLFGYVSERLVANEPVVSPDTVSLVNNNSTSEENVVESTPEPESEEESEYKSYGNGMFKVGVDIPEGTYIVMSSGVTYMEIASDSTGSLDSIISNDNFSSHRFVEVFEGQYLTVTSGSVFGFPVEKPFFEFSEGVAKEGMYRVGIDIPAGEYKVIATNPEYSYIEIETDMTGSLNSILANDVMFSEIYITVNDGEYVTLNSAEIILN